MSGRTPPLPKCSDGGPPDGTTVTQDLRDTREMQTLDIDPVTTQHVRLTLVSVSPPGKGPAARDYTPISDVTLQGTAG